MPLTTAVSRYELTRLAALAYEGHDVRVSLHSVGSTGYDQNTTIANWDTVKVALANGYADVVLDPLPAGGWDATDGRYEMGGSGANTYITATFTGTGAGFTWDRVIIRVNGGTYPHSILIEPETQSLAGGASMTYQIQLLAGLL